MKPWSILILLTLGASTQACYNDRDTLGFELRDKPDVQRALTGRFERNPPLYYQMRVARLRSKAVLSPSEDDDLAVALDRLGKGEEALLALTSKGRVTPNDRYRFFANRGTIHAHRWLRRGWKKGEVDELRQAEKDIAQALAINPKAHFGREAVQLELVRWLDRPVAKADEDQTLGAWLGHRVTNVDPITGLSGLIMLGGAWESPDVAIAIAEISDDGGEFSLADLAIDRYRELLRSSHRSFSAKMSEKAAENVSMDLSTGKEAPEGELPVVSNFHLLRKEADAWNRARTEYMMARLEKGSHPDIDPRFWNGWRESAMPRLNPKRLPRASEVTDRWLLVSLIVAFLLLVGVCIGFVLLAQTVYRRIILWQASRRRTL